MINYISSQNMHNTVVTITYSINTLPIYTCRLRRIIHWHLLLVMIQHYGKSLLTHNLMTRTFPSHYSSVVDTSFSTTYIVYTFVCDVMFYGMALSFLLSFYPSAVYAQAQRIFFRPGSFNFENKAYWGISVDATKPSSPLIEYVHQNQNPTSTFWASSPSFCDDGGFQFFRFILSVS